MPDRHPKSRSLDIDTAAHSFRAPKTAQLVADELRARIVRGELHAGSTLPSEPELMVQFSVSRPALREALRILESESVLTVTRGSRAGPRVNLPDPRTAARHFGMVLQSRGVTLADILAARLMIEPGAVRMLAERPTQKMIRRLRSIIDDQRHAAASDPATLGRIGVRFHKALIELADNPVLVLFMATVNHIFERQMATETLAAAFHASDPQSTEAAIGANSRLVDLIEGGRCDDAERFWREHLAGLARVLRRNQSLDGRIDVLT